jgi:carbon monoxide dehydrogenase subunit G
MVSAVQVSGEQKFKAPKALVYEELMNPDVLMKCIPGCKALNATGEGQYEAELVLGIAAIKGQYTGKVEIRDQQPPDSYTMLVSGAGGPGHVNAEVKFVLEEAGDATIVRYTGDALVGGTIAAVGQRVTGGIAKLMSKQFFGAMAKEIEKRNQTV